MHGPIHTVSGPLRSCAKWPEDAVSGGGGGGIIGAAGEKSAKA